MNIISKKLSLTSLVLAGLMISCVPTTTRTLPGWEDVTKRNMAILFGGGSLVITLLKKAVPNPEEVTAEDFKKLIQVQNIFTQEYWANVAYVIDNFYFGQVGTRGKSIRGIASEEDGSVTFKEESALPSTGICGKTLAFTKVLLKKIKDVGEIIAAPAVALTFWEKAEHFAKGEWKETGDKKGN